jgi:hypothetical protein
VPFRWRRLASNRPWRAGPGFNQLPPLAASHQVIGASHKVQAVEEALDKADALRPSARERTDYLTRARTLSIKEITL